MAQKGAEWIIHCTPCDTTHNIIVEHGTVSGKRKIIVDGKVVEEGRKVVDTGTEHNFEYKGHNMLVIIKSKFIGFTYQLYIDGRKMAGPE